MRPLTPTKILGPALSAAVALVLAAPAGAGNALAPGATEPTWNDHYGPGAAGPILSGDSARGPSATSNAQPVWNDFYGPGAAGPILRRRETAPVSDTTKPASLQALDARSRALNELRGGSAATATRPDDRAVHRPLSRAPLLAESSTGGSTERSDLGLGLVGGLGVGLLLAGSLLLAAHRRYADRVALP